MNRQQTTTRTNFLLVFQTYKEKRETGKFFKAVYNKQMKDFSHLKSIKEKG